MSQFKELVDLIQVEFSPSTGSMAFCVGRPSKGLSICCSCLRNKGMLAAECIVWHEAEVKYEGKLDSYKLKNLLNRWGVCRAYITNVMRLEKGDRGECICLGCR